MSPFVRAQLFTVDHTHTHTLFHLHFNSHTHTHSDICTAEEQVTVHFAKRRIAVSAEHMAAAVDASKGQSGAPANAKREKTEAQVIALMRAIKENILFCK
jgi:hypothetical protein